MASNIITVTNAISVTTVEGGTKSFAVGDEVPYGDPFYYPLLWGNNATDSGQATRVPYKYPPGMYSVMELERQRERQLNDPRAKLPLYSEAGFSVVATGTADSSLTKMYAIDATGTAANGSSIATASQLAQMPVDWGTPAFMKSLFRSGSSPNAIIFNSPSKDPNVAPSGTNGNNFANQEMRFRTNAPKFAVVLYRPYGAVQNGQSVFVNGQPCMLRPTIGTALVDFVYFTFADSQWRDIAVRTQAGIGQIYMQPGYDAVKPDPRAGLSMYCIGDSYSATLCWNDTTTATALQEEGLSCGFEDYLGVAENYIDAISGTGWTIRTNALQGPNNNYLDRWPQVLRANPDVFLVPNGAANDCFNLVDPNTILTNVRACFSSLRAQNPKTKIIWCDGFSPPYPGFQNDTRYTTLRKLLIPALADIGVYYINTLGWEIGTGYSPSNKTGLGNTDWMIGPDACHGTGAGYRYLRSREAQKIRKILVDDGSLMNTVV